MKGMALDFKELKYFVHIYEKKSFSAAAQTAYVTQQALSKAVKRIEEDLGVTLFSRSKGGVEPTSAGITLYKKALELIREFENLPNLLFDEDQLAQGTIKIGMHKGIDVLYYNNILHNFGKRYPKISVDVATMTDMESERAIDKELVDFAVSCLPVDDDKYNFYKIFEDELIALVNKNDVVAKKRKVTFADLANKQILIPDKKHKIHGVVYELAKQHQCEDNIKTCNAYTGFFMNLVSENEGVAIMNSGSLIWQDFRNVIIPIRINPQIIRESGFIEKKSFKKNYINKLFSDYLNGIDVVGVDFFSSFGKEP